MSRNPPTVTLHQQEGALTMQAFAEREGLTLQQAVTAARRGQLLGARQNPLSNRWWVYPPAKLLHRPKSRSKPAAAAVGCSSHTSDEVAAQRLPVHLVGAASGAEQDTPRAAPPSGAGAMAAASCGHAGAYPSQNVARASVPPAKPLLTLDAALPVAARTKEHGAPASCGRPVVYAEARNVCQALHEAAARQFREGLHYLRLDAHEFAQLYAALSNDRRRVRKLIGKKLLPVGLLRASDTVWQKMQAMCHEGRLL